jgi:hypothetical protein
MIFRSGRESAVFSQCKGKTMARKKRLHAEPIKRILDRKTRVVVGWLYRWNTGSEVPMWKDGKRTDVIYE